VTNDRGAPERFAEWMNQNRKTDKFGRVYLYHSRSDAHSVRLAGEILQDLIDSCELLRAQARRGVVGYGINLKHKWPTGKEKAMDLAFGLPEGPTARSQEIAGVPRAKRFHKVYLSCELKATMTEHVKSKPRVFDELGSSHEIVHQGDGSAIAAGVTVVNIAPTFVSPLRNQSADAPLEVSIHDQPHDAEHMVQHLRDLIIRNQVGEVGFDAYCTIVVDCDNQSYARLWTAPPAPQPGDRDHYETFLQRLVKFYEERFGAA
jgi:hypothetical protein